MKSSRLALESFLLVTLGFTSLAVAQENSLVQVSQDAQEQ